MRYYGIKKKILYSGLIVFLFIILLHPSRNAKGTYEFIERDNILSNLLYDTAENFSSTAIVDCDYYNVVNDDSTLSISIADGDLIENHRIKDGGEYVPVECRPSLSTAIIIPYRDRAEQLRAFLVYMHMFLRRQFIHYRIYVVEQVDNKPFNTAKLMNIGAVAAIRAGFPCLVLHNVDLLPLRPANLYACTKLPRHLSSSINKFRFVLPHQNVFSGVVSISSKQFKLINGMTNGNTGDRSDLYNRLQVAGIKITRYEPILSRYYMSSQKLQRKVIRFNQDMKLEMNKDGLNSLKYTEVATVLHPLFTHIMVDL
ncbi:unnamed protein product [Danaus chrysippus]|uniref:Beta-1,4-N-acetylgalactosaminyltransferase n=1 Tax=Danaus chrysippus TaxID=151541 RepID=A0A8J2R648_9NEOP|nr:unnamed protein product [Danaus chrysippus]